MDNCSYKELMDLLLMDIRERTINKELSDIDDEPNTTSFDDMRSVADSTYVGMIRN